VSQTPSARQVRGLTAEKQEARAHTTGQLHSDAAATQSPIPNAGSIRMSGLPVGLLMNFHATRLKDGLKRFIAS
jgi:hypothetical protein